MSVVVVIAVVVAEYRRIGNDGTIASDDDGGGAHGFLLLLVRLLEDFALLLEADIASEGDTNGERGEGRIGSGGHFRKLFCFLFVKKIKNGEKKKHLN